MQRAGFHPVYGLPAGLGFIWYGTIATIPDGFIICDGNNGTQNLLTRYLKQVPNIGTDPGGQGGSMTVSLAIANLAAHAHTYVKPANGGTEYGHGEWNANIDIIGNTSSVGSGTAFNIEPLYHISAFIVKT